MKLRTKLISAFLGVALIAVFVGLNGFYGFRSSSETLTMLTQSDMKIIDISNDVRVFMLECRRDEKNSLIRASVKDKHAQTLASSGRLVGCFIREGRHEG